MNIKFAKSCFLYLQERKKEMKKIILLFIILFYLASCTSLRSNFENEHVMDYTYSIKANTPNTAFDILAKDIFMETFGTYLKIDDNKNETNGYIELTFLPKNPQSFILPVNKSFYMIKIFSSNDVVLWDGRIDKAGIRFFSYSQYNELQKVNERLLDLFLYDTGLSEFWTERL